ncbi:unnamed protein product [Dicrocoelium dendriticum]|nr:unnamed protein product [Dicrocoelium dendriticum]
MIMSSRKMALWGWSKIPRKNRNLLTWNEFLDSAYGSDEVQRQNSQLSADLRLQMRMDKRRWNAADLNGDKKLTFAEYTSFLHPQLENHMRDSLVSDVLETIDRNQDGVVSEHEYLEELARAYRSTYIQGVVEPKWVFKERVQFRKYLDTDRNGLLNHEEIGEWVLPQDYEESEAEAQYLFYHVDLSKDGVLTLDEVMAKADLFLHSQVTNFGKAIEYYLDL